MQVITGFHAVEEMLRSPLCTADGAKPHLEYAKPGPRVKKILEDARKRNIPAKEVTMAQLDSLCANLEETAQNHRGLVLVIDGLQKQAQNFVQFDGVLAALKKKENALVVILDSVTDPHNVGAVIRSCDQFAADLLVLPEHRGASESDVILRSSAGAAAWVPQAVVNNLNRTVELLKEAGFWIYGADAGGSALSETSLKGKVAIVMGSEGSGISRLLKEKCDAILSIPTCGKLDSLNVSVAAGILLYEAHRQQM